MKNITKLIIVLSIICSFGCSYDFQEIEPLGYNMLADTTLDFIHLNNAPSYNPAIPRISFGYRTDYDTFNDYYKEEIYRSIVIINGTVRYRFEPQQGYVPFDVELNQTYEISIAFETREGKRTIIYERFQIET